MRPKHLEPMPIPAGPLAKFPLFQGLSSEALAAIAGTGELRVFRSGAFILRQGTIAEHVYVLFEGVVRVVVTDVRGTKVLAKVFSGPAFFGEMEAMTRTPFIEDVIVEHNSRVGVLAMARFRPLLTRYPIICERLLEDVCARFRTSAKNQAFAAFQPVERRLAALLVSYARSIGVRVVGGIQVLSPAVSQEELADNIGVTRKSVQRAFFGWAKEGLIERRGRALLITKIDRLIELAGEDAPRFDHHLEK